LDAARAELAELRAERDRLLDAWAKDETITADGSLRPTIAATIKRAEDAETERDALKAEVRKYKGFYDAHFPPTDQPIPPSELTVSE